MHNSTLFERIPVLQPGSKDSELAVPFLGLFVLKDNKFRKDLPGTTKHAPMENFTPFCLPVLFLGRANSIYESRIVVLWSRQTLLTYEI
jgi:hypothetical protein